MTRKLTLVLGLIAVLAFAARPALAHHGGAAFDQTKTETLTGTVTSQNTGTLDATLKLDETANADAFAVNDLTLKVMLQRISGATPQQVRDLLDNELKSKTDPFVYEVRQARTADAAVEIVQGQKGPQAADVTKAG